jgi:transposase-like protein
MIAVTIPKFFELVEIMACEKKSIEFLVDQGICNMPSACERCGGKVNRYGHILRCTTRTCRKQSSLFRGSFFFQSRLKSCEVVHMLYLWLSGCSHGTIMIHTGHSSNTVTDYMNYFRELVGEMVEGDNQIIGGEGVRVQVDETKIGKRKYHRGHRVDGAWVIVGVEKTLERRVFAEVVQNRNSETIRHVLEKHLAEGSILQTDCWGGYREIERIFGIRHETVNHSVGFKDAVTGVDTNTVEGTNFAIKRSIPIRDRTETFIPSHLLEFIWRRENASTLWNSIIRSLREIRY